MKFLLLLLSALLLLSYYPLLIQGAGEEGTEEAATNKASCSASHDTLFAIIYEDLFEEAENLTIYVNCLSFDKTGALNSGIVSGVNISGGGGLRLILRCVRNAILVTESTETALAVNMSSTACVNCTDQATDVCNQPCAATCERCYDSPDSCTRCVACNNNEVEGCLVEKDSVHSLENCGSECTAIGKEVIPEQYNFCDCPHGYYRELLSYPPAEEEEEEGVIPEGCSLNPELEDFTCVKNCTVSMPGFYPNEELHETCFACGLEYCLRCNRTTSQCSECLEHTVLFEYECFACPLANIALVALEQEEELEEEESEARKNQIELAVTLPILSVLIILFFLGMSVFAHYRYPHINPSGHKRHRTNPDDFDDNVTVSNPSASSPPESLEVLGGAPQGDIWRARPTVRLR